MNSVVLSTCSGPITTLTLNRPERRNALNVALLQQLGAEIGRAEMEPGQRVLVLRGAGPVFCSGLDLQEATDPDVGMMSATLIGDVLKQLATSRLITIAAVQGAALAGGAGLMAACDFVVATADAVFGFPEVHRGLVPALIMTFLRRQVRERDVREWLLLGEKFDANRAHALGLINRIAADPAALDAEVASLARAALAGAPEAVAATKHLLLELWPSSLATDLGRAHALHLAARSSSEAAEGLAAFHAKRLPRWNAP